MPKSKKRKLSSKEESKIWFHLYDYGTGKPYKGTTADKVSVPPGSDITELRKAVKAEYSDSHLKDIPSGLLKVFKNKQSFDKRDAAVEKGVPLDEDSPVDDLGKSLKDALIVAVPSSDALNFTGSSPQTGKIDWKISKIKQLSYDPSSVLFVLDSNYLENTGLGSEKLFLYCRPTFHEQVKFLNDRVINEGALGWILGPRGTGKSTTALAFASTLDKKDWVVTWIHLSRDQYPVCVRLDGDLKKSRRISFGKIDELVEILGEVADSKQHIVFVDGYALNVLNHSDVQQACYFWLETDREKRRLAIVCSMSSRYKVKPHEDMQMNVEEFFVYSWKVQEYLDAVQNPDFFSYVKNLLDTDLSFSSSAMPEEMVNISPYVNKWLDSKLFKNSPATPEELVLSKHYFAGSSARWMFNFSTKKVIEFTKNSVKEVDDIMLYIKGMVGPQSNNVVNRLLSTFLDSDGEKISIVSRFAGVELAIKAGPELISQLSQVTKLDGNPSMDGWLLEMWFFASLRSGGVTLLDKNGTVQQTWPQYSVRNLDMTSFPSLPKNDGVWFKPNKWNQGGFDAIYMNKSIGLVRFVQITGGDTHSFKIEYFYSFLFALSQSPQSFEITCLEIFFVVDLKKSETFTLAEPSGVGLLQTFGWDYGKERNKVNIFFIQKWNESALHK